MRLSSCPQVHPVMSGGVGSAESDPRKMSQRPNEHFFLGILMHHVQMMLNVFPIWKKVHKKPAILRIL